MKHEEYLKRRDELESIRATAFSSFDKAILSLATGCLALSIAFLDKIGEPFNKMSFCFIVSAWIAFLLVIICNLASYLFAQKNMDNKIEDLRQRYQIEIDGAEDVNILEKVFWQRKATDLCNKGAFWLFVVGVLCFVIYIVLIQAKNYQNLIQ